MLKGRVPGVSGWISGIQAAFLIGDDEIQVLLFILNEAFVGVLLSS